MSKSKSKKPEVPKLPDGCGYMGREFGASYLDSQCFGGQLYDLDNCDGDMLYEPMEYIACPNCQMEEWLERQAESVGHGISGWGNSSLPEWQSVCRHALGTNRDEALRLLNGRFKKIAYLEETKDRKDLQDREWEFNESELELPAAG